MERTNICVIGSGNVATIVGKILAENALALPEMEDRVNMFVYDELFEGKSIVEVINIRHINAKYAPMLELPENLVACSDLVETARYADIILFAIPQRFIVDFCKTLFGKIKPNAMAISLIKGFTPIEGGGIELISQTIGKYLKIPCGVMMAVNLASEVALKQYCESTLGCRDMKYSKLLKDLFTAPNFRVIVVDDVDCVEVCGFLKHLIAFAAGLLDGVEANENSKSACIRFAIIEIIRFLDVFYPGCNLSTLFESCGIADLITVCYGSRNRRLAEAFVKTGGTIEQLETELMGGEKQWGPLAAKEVHFMLKQKGLLDRFPLFTMVYKICQCTAKPVELLDCLSAMPNIIYHPTNLFPL